MDPQLISSALRSRRRTPEAGFSMIELLLAAFIMAVGLLGLLALQLMVIRNTSVSHMRMTGIQVGQAILESLDNEARLQHLFRTQDPGSIPPALSPAFGAAVPGAFNFYGTAVNPASPDPVEKIALFTTTTVGTLVPNGAGAASGAVYDMAVTVTYDEGPNPSNPAEMLKHSMTFRRKVSL